jgi:hypothetical protein
LIGFDYPNRKAMIFGAAENPISFITIADVSEAAAQAAINAGAANGDIEVGAPEPVSPNAAVRILRGGHRIAVRGAVRPGVGARGPEGRRRGPAAQSVTALSLAFAHGDVVDTSTMTALLPLERSSVRQYIEALARG